MVESVAIAAISLAGAICAGFFKLVNDQNKVHSKIASGLEKVAKGQEKVAKANREIAKETRQGNKESAERNGHLGELIIKQGEMTKEIASNAVKDIVSGVQHVGKQEVGEQVVKSQKEV